MLVDGRNVQRSAWPNPDAAELLEALVRWSAQCLDDEELVVVFDGHVEPEQLEPALGRATVICVSYADDEIVTLTERAVAAGRRARVATSDRELRTRVEAAGGEVAWGGGRLLAEVGLR